MTKPPADLYDYAGAFEALLELIPTGDVLRLIQLCTGARLRPDNSLVLGVVSWDVETFGPLPDASVWGLKRWQLYRNNATGRYELGFVGFEWVA
jgi:hypothetical protein